MSRARFSKTSMTPFMLIFLCIGCTPKASDQKASFEYDIVLTDSITYLLDEDTRYGNSYCQYIKAEDQDYFSFINEYLNSIYFYNPETGKFVRSIPLEVEGANGVGRVQGYCYLNEDSIFTYSYGSERCYLVNNESEVQNKYSLFAGEVTLENCNMYYNTPYTETLSPIIYKDNHLLFPSCFYFETSLETNNNTGVTMLCNLTDNSVKLTNPYPEIYSKHDWGGDQFFRQTKWCLGLDGDIVISFPADSNLWTYNLATGKFTSHEASSTLVENIVPLNDTKELETYHQLGVTETWYYNQPNYEGIFADTYNNIYYRIVRLPLGNIDHVQGINDKRVAICAYDKDFNLIAETVLPREKFIYNSFKAYVSPKGLNIHIWDPNDENQWKFHTFSLKKK